MQTGIGIAMARTATDERDDPFLTTLKVERVVLNALATQAAKPQFPLIVFGEADPPGALSYNTACAA